MASGEILSRKYVRRNRLMRLMHFRTRHKEPCSKTAKLNVNKPSADLKMIYSFIFPIPTYVRDFYLALVLVLTKHKKKKEDASIDDKTDKVRHLNPKRISAKIEHSHCRSHSNYHGLCAVNPCPFLPLICMRL